MDHFAVRAVPWGLGNVGAKYGIGVLRRRLAFVGVPSTGFFDCDAAFAEFAKELCYWFDELEGDFYFQL